MTPPYRFPEPLSPLAAAIYIRVSTPKQKEKGYSLPEQLEACAAYAQQYGFQVSEAHIFVDDETGKILDRPGLDELRQLISARQIQAVIILEMDRLGRNLGHQILLMKAWEALGVQVFDTTAPPSEPSKDRTLLRNIQGAIAEYEREQFMERTERGRRGRAKAGYPLPQMVAYGYCYAGDPRTGTYAIVEAEAQVVRWIFRWYVEERLTPYKIVQRLNRQGVPTHTVVRGRKRQNHRGLWHTSTIYVILHNETYIGSVHYGKTTGAPSKHHPEKKTSSRRTPRDTWIPIVVPPLITVEQFEAAQTRLALQAATAKRPAKYDYLVGGGRMRCGCCEAVMGGTGSKERRYYRCSYASTGMRPPCRRHVNAVQADREIWDAICAFVRQPRQVLDLMESAIRGDTPAMQQADLAERERELARVQAEIGRWEAAYGAGAITLDNFTAKRQRLEREAEALTVRIGLLRETQSDLEAWQEERRTYEAWLKGLAQTLDELKTLEERQWLLDALRLRVIYTRKRHYQLHVMRRQRGKSSNAMAGHGTYTTAELPWLTWTVPAA